MTGSQNKCIPELWGGIECSINRVGDNFFDQLDFSNHYQRGEDIERIAQLGVKALRYPILWESHQLHAHTKIDWRWATTQLNSIVQNGMNPIAGLLHHGSGPAFTNLCDENFSKKFVDYATQVAEQFPWLTKYTPINEPLTTARFSGLYGFWYPHCKDDFKFTMMLLNQLKGIVLSMQAIRKINPKAELIQTEDLGKTYSTPLLKYQADFENHRRWLTYDFLCGKVDRNHPLWKNFIELGIPEKELYFFQENICPPDLLGINYYLTSERYLDENINAYPAHTQGGNKQHIYADVEAIRVKHHNQHGLLKLLLEAWQRFDIPLALTEVHMHCTREEQIRWLKEKMDTATACLQHNIPVKAITAWSIFGAFGWNKLLTELPFEYEAGIFDLSTGEPRATALAALLQKFSAGERYQHPVLDQPAWWNRKDRFIIKSAREREPLNTASRSVFIISNNNNTLIAECIHDICKLRGILSYTIHLESGQDLHEIEQLVKTYNPWAVISTSDLYEEKTFYNISDDTFSLPYVLENIKFVGLIPSWFDVPENIFNHIQLKPLYVRVDITDHEDLFEIENLYNINPSSLRTILSSFSYIPQLIHSLLNLMIDDQSGTWEATNSATAILQEVVPENAFN